MTTGASLLIGASSANPSWDAIDWQTAERSVRRLQMRIAKATRVQAIELPVHEISLGRNQNDSGGILAVETQSNSDFELRRRVRSLALERLERCEGKLSRTVLRGGSDRKVAPLTGRLSDASS